MSACNDGKEMYKNAHVQSCCFANLNLLRVQRRQRNVQKCVMHVQSCRFADLNLLLFSRSRFLFSPFSSPSSFLKLRIESLLTAYNSAVDFESTSGL